MANKKPLDGLSFCCTGIKAKKREEIAEKIAALGGIHYSDLMSDVRFLLVGDRDTAKYQFCIKERYDVTFLTEDSILELYDCWIRGDDDDSEKLQILSYKQPVFSGLSICISRIESSDSYWSHLFTNSSFRKKPASKESLSDYFMYRSLASEVAKNGGKPADSLTNSNSCIVTTQTGGKRYSKAVEWRIPVVHPLWIHDSLIRGAALDMEDYKLSEDTKTLYESGSKVWKQLILAKTQPEQSTVASVAVDANEFQAEKTKKPLKKNAEIWNSIMDHTRQQTRRFVRDSLWDDEPESDLSVPKSSILEKETIRTSSFMEKRSIQEQKELQQRSLFSGYNFLLIGFTDHQANLLSQAIANHGGEISTDTMDSTITHIILPAANGSQSSMMLKILAPSIKSKISDGDIKVVTEWFIERSIFYSSAVIDRWSQPLKGMISSNKKFKICITGFTGIELLHIEKLINNLGFEFCETLTSKRDLLIININLFKTNLSKNSPKLFQYKYPDITNCPTYQSGTSSVSVISSKNKINAAKKWEIPIVSISYLWEILELSVNREVPVMPDLLDLTWCIFAPKNYSRPKSLLEYVQNMHPEEAEQTIDNGGSIEPEDREDATKRKLDEDDSIMKLPSPRRNSTKKQKYGRLVGRQSPESITAKLTRVAEAAQQSEDEKMMDDNDVTNIEDDEVLTQVRYQDYDSLRNNEELLKKLGESEVQSELDKENNTRSKSKTSRRSSRMTGKYSK
ncbi:hypothetical protein G9P44_004107 [Scheffersomyces stipitis]|nr:hypothetical protein G9P44_004107 [Scheffersomyces stipitis]